MMCWCLPTMSQPCKNVLRHFKTRLAEKQITTNKEKSITLNDEVSFLGFHISARGIEPDGKLMNKINSMKHPLIVWKIECFLVLLNYFGRLIPNFSKKTAPLDRLRKSYMVTFHNGHMSVQKLFNL